MDGLGGGEAREAREANRLKLVGMCFIGKIKLKLLFHGPKWLSEEVKGFFHHGDSQPTLYHPLTYLRYPHPRNSQPYDQGLLRIGFP